MNASKSAVLATAVLLVSLMAGCDLFSGTSTGIDEESEHSFNQKICRIPNPQNSNLKTKRYKHFGLRSDLDVTAPVDVFYSTGWGLKVQDRIGWMRVSEAFCLRDSLQDEVTLFDVQPRDSTLFSADFRAQFKSAVEDEAPDGYGPIYEVFLQMLARDADTPVPTLRSLTELLFDEYLPGQAQALIENPAVRSNEPLLERLAALPDQSAYRSVREEAQALLDDIREGEAAPM